VQVFHFVAKGYQEQRNTWDTLGEGLEFDLEFLFRAVKKIEQIREDLGKVGPVIAQQVEEAMLGKRRKLDTAQAERDNEPIKRILKFERDLRAQIARHMDQLQESRQVMNFTAQNTERIAATALDLAGQHPLVPVKVISQLTDHSDIPQGAYDLPPLTGSWAACAEGLAHPHTGKMRPIVFDHNLVDGRDDVVLAHLNHRLVQMSLRLLRAEVWSPTSNKGLHRITARVAPDHALTAPAVIAFARLVVIGGDQNRLHEEIIFAGGLLKEGKLERINVTQARAALDAMTSKEPSEQMKHRLLSLYPQIVSPLIASLEARRKDRMDSVYKLLEEREEFETNSITAILTELAGSIKDELNEPEVLQLALFSFEEKDQLNRNLDALRRRLKAIPGEIDQEKEVIRKRFADPQARMFPVAVVFIVPEKLARS